MDLHVFSLPPEILESLTPRNLLNQPSRAPSPPPPSTPEPANTPAGARTCNICTAVVFSDVEEQRSHHRSDWHRYNVKTRLGGGKAVTEAEFSQLVDSLDDSISGSESSSDESDGSESDAVDALVSKQKRARRASSNEEEFRRSAAFTAVTWFHSPPSTQIGVYRAIFERGASDYLAELKGIQTSAQGRTWAMFMVAGGHFAGAVVRVSKSDDEKADDRSLGGKKKQKPKPEIDVLNHKTFHRYTTRRKQGGSQGLNDNAKGNAKSAGATLRRYGEQALRDDIRNLIEEWKDEINNCERIWIRASGVNRKIFMDYNESILTKTDERLRTFPFPTRRPTQAELTRCLHELTRVKISHLTEDALRAQDEAYLASLPKPKPKPAPAAAPTSKIPEKEKPPVLSKEEEALRDRWDRLLEMIRKGKVDALKSFWEKYSTDLGGIDAPIPEWTDERLDSLLQVATQYNQEETVRWLLEDAHANPTIAVSSPQDNGEQHIQRRVAYDLAHNRAVRDVYRRVAGDHPDWWDWFGAGRIPSALSKEREDEREEKKKARRKGLKDRVRERESKEKEKEVAMPEPPAATSASTPLPPSKGPQKLGGTSGASEGVLGLSPEMRAKIERERRARAAEARLAALNKKS